jgi:hypothetical protein
MTALAAQPAWPAWPLAPRPYAPPAEVEAFVRLLVASPLIDQAFLKSWFSILDPTYRNTLDDLPSVLGRLQAAFARFNNDAPLDGGAIPLVVALEHLILLQADSVIVDGAKQLLSRVELSAPGQVPAVPAVFQELRLTGAGLFADRDGLRDKLIRMSRDDGPPAVIVNGARDAGKTHTRNLVAHVSQKTLAFRFAWVEIEAEQAASYTADWLIEELVRSAVPAADGLPARREPVLRWLGDLVAWAVKQLATQGTDRPMWMVIDGLRHPSLPREVGAVVERLAALVATPTGALPLRLVLIDCDPVGILRTGCMAEEEAVGHLTGNDAERLLRGVLDAATFSARWPRVQAMLAATAAPTTLQVSAAMRSAL